MKSVKWLYWAVLFCFLSVTLNAASIPLPPNAVKSVTRSNGMIVLSWNPSPSPSIGGYRLYLHKLGENKFELFNHNLLIGETEFPLWQFEPGTYCFRIRAVRVNRPGLESADSQEIWVKVGEPKVEFKKDSIETKGRGFVDIAKETGMRSFPDPRKNGVLGYEVYMSDDLEHFGLVNEEPLGNVESFVIKNLEVGKKYYFACTILAKDSESAKSALLGVTAKPYGSSEVKNGK